MIESSTYRYIMAEGEKKLLLRLGRKRFGPPDSQTLAAIDAIANLGKIERLGDRLLDVTTWEELLATPRNRRRQGKRQQSS